MMTEIREKAFAKLNLSLDVTGKREDGYHEVCMVMQSVTLYDDVTIRLTDDGMFSAKTNRGFIPGDDRNEAVKAAKVFAAAHDLNGKGVFVDIHKRTPVRAGLGGGSSDAAAVLRGLNTLCGHPFGSRRLEELAAQVGSDVAFCVCGGTQLATGRGGNPDPVAGVRGALGGDLQAAFFHFHPCAVSKNRRPKEQVPPGHGRYSGGFGNGGQYGSRPADVQCV